LLPDFRKSNRFGGATQYAIVPDTNISFGKDVQGKPADEFHSIQDHTLLLSFLPIVFVTKGHRLRIDRFDPVITDRYFMSVSAKIFYHMAGMGKRSFGIQYPLLFE
jgi:hypothetical protein